MYTDLWLNEIDSQGGVCDDCYDKLGHGSLVRDHPHFAPDPYKATGLSLDGSSAWLSMNGSGNVHTSTRPENGYVCQFDCLREYVANETQNLQQCNEAKSGGSFDSDISQAIVICINVCCIK